MIQDLILSLRGETEDDILMAAQDAAAFLESLKGLQKSLQKLQEVAFDSLIHDELDETAKGHRQGTIEVCEAVLKMF